MFRRRSVATLCVVALLLTQPACGLWNRSGERNTEGDARPAPHFRTGFNLFTPEQDIELGRQSAAKISEQVPLMTDEPTVSYVRQLGARLAAKAPGFPFTYHFEVVASREINAFALPGGYIFVNAGTIAAAKNEGELAGVIAHEISHVALRHGTNQASKAYVAKTGLSILRGIAGGDTDLGNVIEALGGAGANMVFLKFGRTAETQADVEGAYLLAGTGYDPRDMAGFFETLEANGGNQRAPEMLSDHPNPGNRAASINKLLPSLRMSQNPVRDSKEFQQVKARLTGKSAPLSSSKEPARVGPRDPNDNKPGARPEPPSASLGEFQARDGSFSLRYPQNWDVLTADEVDMIFAPKGAYGQKGSAIFVTHGIFIGAVAPKSSDLESANARFVQQQIDMNPDFRVARAPQAVNFGGRPGFATVVTGPSAVTGVVEVDVIYTTATADGRLFYLITIAPEDEFQAYQPTFDQIINSLRLAG
jgi:beta-barrel assembly-enhancing protease